MREAAARAEARLHADGVRLTLGGEPTYVPLQPEGAEWTVAADGPTKLTRARALADALQERVWPEATQILCPGKTYEGEANPRWALRLLLRQDGGALVRWPAHGGDPLPASAVPALLEAVGDALGCPLQAVEFRDPLHPRHRVWAIPLTHPHERPTPEWRSVVWPLDDGRRELLPVPGAAGLRLPLGLLPEGIPRQVLTLEVRPEGWELFLPAVARRPWEVLLQALATASSGWSRPRLSGITPLDTAGHWQVLGLTADPGVLEVNLPVCSGWADYAGWLTVLEEATASVGLRSWRDTRPFAGGTGGGNHLLWGGPDLDHNPFFSQPRWLAAILRYWHHHPCLSYGFANPSIGPASQAPRADEGSAGWDDLLLAQWALMRLEAGDQRVMLGETLRHLQADRSGNTHRSEISLDKFWNPAWPSGCQGLIEFRAIETLPHAEWSAAVALLWTALAAHLRDPRRAAPLQPWGAALHDRMLLPAILWQDLMGVLDDLAGDGLLLQPAVFERIWAWRFPTLLDWRDETGETWLQVRAALEPWPLICDTPVEGGFTSRFVDSSIRRIEIRCRDGGHRLHAACNGRPLPLRRQPLGLRYRAERLYPCLHPAIPIHLPLALDLHWRDPRGTDRRARFVMTQPNGPFHEAAPPDDPVRGAPLQPPPDLCCIDLRFAPPSVAAP
jgi:uncharacterized protein (DUF2126 family)